MYVSITGLRVRGLRQVPLFWWHAGRSMLQAKRSDGNISAQACKANGVQHTLTVWQNRTDLLRFLRSKAHLGAVRAAERIGTSWICGYEADIAPDWDEALAYWRVHRREY
jgi:hypothetical protein